MRVKSFLVVAVSLVLAAGCERSDTNPKLAQRVAELEGQVATLRSDLAKRNGEVAAIESTMAFVARVALKPPTESHFLTVQSIIFRDENGNTRAMLAATENGPALWMYDEAGKTRIALRVGKDGPSCSICDSDGKERAALGTAHLAVTKTGEHITRAESSLVLFDKDDKVLWQTP